MSLPPPRPPRILYAALKEYRQALRQWRQAMDGQLELPLEGITPGSQGPG